MSHHQHQSARAAPVREAAMFSGLALALISAAAGVFSNHTLFGIGAAEAAVANTMEPVATKCDNRLLLMSFD